jgi:hypothetical protein
LISAISSSFGHNTAKSAVPICLLKYSLINQKNCTDKNIKEDSNLEQGMIRGNYTSFSFRHKKSLTLSCKAFIYMAPPDGLEF